jgi:enoyl-CoA hydratase
VTCQYIITEKCGQVGVIRLNRPDALNALNNQLMEELTQAVDRFEQDDEVGALVITGNDKAFAAGADIKDMKDMSFMYAYMTDFVTKGWERVSRCRKPVVAAVAGYALGGGCELAMMCDFILAGDNAKFGQPEATIGALPGAGGTQRLTRAVGKAKAMEMCLTGRMMTADEAERAGLVSRIVPVADLMNEAVRIAEKMAKLSRPALYMIKESINRAFETTLHEGILFERRMFHAMFATDDIKEGMSAFAEKRPPIFVNR